MQMIEEGEADFDAGQIPENPLPSQLGTHSPAVPKEETAHGNDSQQEPKPTSHGFAAQTIIGTSAPREDAGDSRSMYSNNGRPGEYEPRYGDGRGSGMYSRSPVWGSGPAEDELYYRRSARSRSRSTSRTRSRSRGYSRRTSYGFYDNGTPSRRGDANYRADEGDYRAGSYRSNRYSDREYSRAGGYHRRYDRDPPRYRRREPGRYPYARGGYGGYEEMDENELARRDIDKERAIEELRSRVRAVSDRQLGTDVPPTEISPSTRRVSNGYTDDASADARHTNPSTEARIPEEHLSPTKQGTAPSESELPAAGVETADSVKNTQAAAGSTNIAAESGQAPDPDDIEEGEHIEGEIDQDKPLDTEYPSGRSGSQLRSKSRSDSSYSHSRTPYPTRSRSRVGQEARERGRSRSRSRSRHREYSGDFESHGPGGRRTAEYRDFSSGAGGSSTYRKRPDDYNDRRDYRARDFYGSRSTYNSRYSDGYSSRYGNPNSPDAREGGYRSARRYYNRYDRYDSGDVRLPTEPRYYDNAISPAHQHPRSPRSARDDIRPARRDGSMDRYMDPAYPSRPLSRGVSPSRSPLGYSREPRTANAVYDAAESTSRRQMYPGHMGIRHSDAGGANSRSPISRHHYGSPSTQPSGAAGAFSSADTSNPPPPPPPMPQEHSSNGHSSRSVGERPESPSHYQPHDMHYRTYSSRSIRHHSGTPIRGSYSMSSSHTPYGGRNEHESHSRNSSTSGHYHGNQSYQQSRMHSPSGNQQYGGGSGLGDAGASQQEGEAPVLGSGADYCISKIPGNEEWLDAREQARDHGKRVRGLSTTARKTGFELSYANWGLHKAETQVQLALWQLERAEQGLESGGRSLIDSTLNGI
ncbi:hypothetical protein GGI12_000596 [Dipsacomyces acuminosporus]|nr:hypothetical protein GGI12_000596 [Dipsacomyces acuminosporus]